MNCANNTLRCVCEKGYEGELCDEDASAFFGLSTEEAAGVSAGVVAAIIVAGIVVAIAVTGGAAGAAFALSKRPDGLQAIASNPLFEQAGGQGTNPLFDDSAADGVDSK